MSQNILYTDFSSNVLSKWFKWNICIKLFSVFCTSKSMNSNVLQHDSLTWLKEINIIFDTLEIFCCIRYLRPLVHNWQMEIPLFIMFITIFSAVALTPAHFLFLWLPNLKQILNSSLKLLLTIYNDLWYIYFTSKKGKSFSTMDTCADISYDFFDTNLLGKKILKLSGTVCC